MKVCYHLGEENIVFNVLVKDSYAKKVGMTLGSTCMWKLSNDSIIIILVVEPTLDQESHDGHLESLYDD